MITGNMVTAFRRQQEAERKRFERQTAKKEERKRVGGGIMKLKRFEGPDPYKFLLDELEKGTKLESVIFDEAHRLGGYQHDYLEEFEKSIDTDLDSEVDRIARDEVAETLKGIYCRVWEEFCHSEKPTLVTNQGVIVLALPGFTRESGWVGPGTLLRVLGVAAVDVTLEPSNGNFSAKFKGHYEVSYSDGKTHFVGHVKGDVARLCLESFGDITKKINPRIIQNISETLGTCDIAQAIADVSKRVRDRLVLEKSERENAVKESFNIDAALAVSGEDQSSNRGSWS